MEAESEYLVKITPEAEHYYLEILYYLYHTHDSTSANKKSSELLELAMSLCENPNRGTDEETLKYLGKKHKRLVYQITTRNTIKIIYYVEESNKTVYITDFFPTVMNPNKMKRG